jgi:hypothetical protein
MDEQTLTTFEENLMTLLQFTKRISPEKENLTREEIEFFSGIAVEVGEFMIASTEIHIKYVGLREPGWMASYWSLIYQFFLLGWHRFPYSSSIEYIKRTKRVVLERIV